MYTTSPDSRLSMNAISKSSLRKLGTIKLLILAVMVPVMFLTIVNPMWICIFMKYPHIHRYIPTTPANVEDHHVSHNNPQTHTHTKSYKGGIKITKETFDVIVASKDGHHLEELEASVTIIESIPPSSENQHHKQHDTNKKETTNVTNVKAHAQVNKPPSSVPAIEVKNNDESIMDRIRERLFKNRKRCAYFALFVMFLCAATIYGVAYLSNDNKKMYESVNDDDHYVRIDYNDDDDDRRDNEKLNENNENNVTESNQNISVTEHIQVQINDNTSPLTSSLPSYSSNTDNELIPIPLTSTSENIQQSIDKN